MNQPLQKMNDDTGHFADHARALIAATADNARDRLTLAMEGGKAITHKLRNQARHQTRACDLVVRENPYQAIGIAVGVGLLLGYFLIRE